MNKLAITVSAAALLLGSVALGMAADNDTGKSESAPGQKMLEEGGRGGSFAPGRDRDDLSGRGHQELRDRDDRSMTRDRDDTKTLRDKDDRGALGGGTMDRDRR